MANGIVDCTGKAINIGDKVRTEHGDVILVRGGMVSEHKLFNAEKCSHVDKNTPLTNTGHISSLLTNELAGEKKKPVVVYDCVVWGT